MIFPLSFQLNSVIEFSERPREASDFIDYAQVQEALEDIECSKKEQNDLGLGLAEFKEKERLLRLLDQSKRNQIAEFCKPINEPSKKLFKRFEKPSFSGRRVEYGKVLPKVVMVLLEKGIYGIDYEIEEDSEDYYHYEASIPLIPKTHLELAKRVRKIDKEALFYLIYVPEWVKVEVKDPALVVKSGSEWFQVGISWGGDAELIEKYLNE